MAAERDDPRPVNVLLLIAFAGLALSLLFHFVWGTTLHQAYPRNTFLFTPRVQFTDLFDTLRAAASGRPYDTAAYFPLTYLFFRPLAWLTPVKALLTLVLATLGFTAWFMRKGLTERPKIERLQAALLLTLSYPVLFCLDRANVEAVVFMLLAGFLLAYHAGRTTFAAVLLAMAGSMKLYPFFLGSLFIADRNWRGVAITAGASALLTGVALLTFTATMPEHLAGYNVQMARYHDNYTIGNLGLGHCTSIFCGLKASLYFVSDKTELAQLLDPVIFERVYNFFTLVVIAGTVALLWLRKPEPWQRVALVTLPIICLTPVSADYKLMHMLLIIHWFAHAPAGSRTVLDGVLLGLLIVPKDYILHSQILSDSGHQDVSIAVVLNPLIIAVLFATIVQRTLRLHQAQVVPAVKTNARVSR